MPCSRERKRCNPKLKELRGWIIEDVWISKYRDWEPHLQAIKHDKRGLVSLRYCYYKKAKGRKTWVPVPSFLYKGTISDFRKEIKKCKLGLPIIEALLKRFVEK
jgi:hypothetical protein